MTKVERSICKSNILFAQAVEQLLLVFGSSAMNSHGSHKQCLCQRIGKSQSRAVREPGGAKVNATRRILDAFRVSTARNIPDRIHKCCRSGWQRFCREHVILKLRMLYYLRTGDPDKMTTAAACSK